MPAKVYHKAKEINLNVS